MYMRTCNAQSHTRIHTYIHTHAHAHTYVHMFLYTHATYQTIIFIYAEGLIAERYCFKLTLILLALATLKKEEDHTIIDVTTDVLFQLAVQFQKLEEKSSGNCMHAYAYCMCA